MIIDDTTLGLLRRMNEQLENSALRILSAFPLETYQNLLMSRNKFNGYRDPGNAVVNLCEDFKKYAGADILGSYHRSLLVHLIATHAVQCSLFPEAIQAQYLEEFKRIIAELDMNPAEWYSWDEDLFCKDVAICCHRMFPAGCLKTEIHAGVPRSMIVKVNPSELIRFSSLMLRLGGFGPFFEIHLDVRYKKNFNPEGWEEALRLVGQTLKMLPEIKGIIGSSWFFDPIIPTISPRLTYLRQQIEENGGKFFFAGSNNRVIELATVASASRKKLYEEGSYIPSSYLTIWPRENVLEWIG